MNPPGDALASDTARVMLLSVWAPPGAPWHARLVDMDAQAREFDSPFELARFLAWPTSTAKPEPSPGLR